MIIQNLGGYCGEMSVKQWQITSDEIKTSTISYPIALTILNHNTFDIHSSRLSSENSSITIHNPHIRGWLNSTWYPISSSVAFLEPEEAPSEKQNRLRKRLEYKTVENGSKYSDIRWSR